MYQIFDSLNGQVYKEFIQLLIERSDSFLFHLPNMGKLLVNERNSKFMSRYPIGYSKESNQDLHMAYIERMNKYLNLIQDDIIESYTDTGYLDQMSNIAIEVYHVAISVKTKTFFEQTNNFSKWIYPDLPEDPCFLSRGKCAFQCIAHEQLYFLYMDDMEIIDFLKSNRIDFEFIHKAQVPTMNKF